jgi:hypothetical protein
MFLPQKKVYSDVIRPFIPIQLRRWLSPVPPVQYVYVRPSIGRMVMMAGIGFGAGALLGASLMYLLDPSRGRRRRHLIRDQAVHAKHEITGTLDERIEDFGNRVRGFAAEARAQLRETHVDDDVLVERVRATLGHVAHHPRRIEVTARDGRITLGGSAPAEDIEQLVTRARTVRGVIGVTNELRATQPSAA